MEPEGVRVMAKLARDLDATIAAPFRDLGRSFEPHHDFLLGAMGHDPLEIEAIGEVVDKIDYKQGWRFTAIDACEQKISGCIVHIEASFPSSRGLHTHVPFLYHVCGAVYSVAQLVDGIGQGIQDIENHEFKEWFRFEGEFVNDPHPPGCTFRVVDGPPNG